MNLSTYDTGSDLVDGLPYLELPISRDPGSLLPINMRDYSEVVRRVRQFFEEKGWYEVFNQSRLSILSASMDPNTIVTYNFAGQVWPLPQSGQLWLEYELLSHPEAPGVFCLSSSYNDGASPLVEFETRGSMKELLVLETQLLEHLGFDVKELFVHNECVLEENLPKEGGVGSDEGTCDGTVADVIFNNVPNSLLPFWNMKQGTDSYTGNMEVVILHGKETIRSAARATNKEEMRNLFCNTRDGDYAKSLFSKFTKERVLEELDKYLQYDMVDRCGGEIGVTALIRAMNQSNILYVEDNLDPEITTDEEVIEEPKIKTVKRAKSRCWGLPVAAKDHSAAIGSLLVGAATAGGEKAIELAINSI